MGFVKSNKSSLAQEESRINAIQYEQSTFGTTKSVLYGTNRICGNVIDNVDFTAIEHKQTQKMGKGGASQTSTSYTYKSRVVIGLCCGTINSIKKVLFDDGVYSLNDLNLALFKGTATQGAWGEMISKHPDHALNYRHLAYVAGYVDLTTSGGVPQYNFEVSGKFTSNTDDITPIITEGYNFEAENSTLGNVSGTIEYAGYFKSVKYVEVIYSNKDGATKTISNFKNYSIGNGRISFNLSGLGAVNAVCYLTYNSTIRLDANPKDIILDILTNSVYGVGFSKNYIDMATVADFSNFCIANNIFLSPVYDAQEEAQSILTELAEICNSTFVWTQGKLKLLPLGDEKVTDNGKTWTPNLQPVYDLTEEDFIDDDEPIICTRTDQADIYNSVKIEFKNRANDYNVEIAEAQDNADIELYGLRAADTKKAHQICTAEIAHRTAQMALNRAIAVRNTYRFKLPIRYILLEPMDIVTLTYERMGLSREPVRIIKIEENDEGQLEIEAEEMVIGTATPAKIQTQRAVALSIDANQQVGNVNPVLIFEPPFELTQDTLEVWIGVSSNNNLFGGCEVWVSDDEQTYKLKGRIDNQIRQGVLVNHLLNSSNNPDMTQRLVVDMNMSNSELLSGTKEDADRLNTLCYVDGELLAFQNAELSDIGIYTLSYLNRGAYSSKIGTHYAGTQFARIDDGVFFRIPFCKEDIGKKLAIKFPTFNSFGAGLQTLGDLNPYYYTIQGTALTQAPENVTGLTNYYSDGLNIITWQPVDDTRNVVYEVRKGTSWGKGQCLGRISGNTFTANGNGTYFIKAFVPDYNIYSVEAASLEITGARLVQNVIEVIDENALAYPGEKSEGMFIDDYGVLSLSGKGLVSEIPVFSEIGSLLFYGGLYQEGIYECEQIVDIGAAAKCYIFVDYNFMGENPYATFAKIPLLSAVEKLVEDFGEFITNSRIQISIAGDDGVFSKWQDFVTGQYYGRKFKFRAILASSSPNIVAKLGTFTINVDVPDIVETGNSILIPIEGTRIEFKKYFHTTPNLQVTILDKEQGDDEFIINLNSKGFDISLKNLEVPITKTINFVAQGY